MLSLSLCASTQCVWFLSRIIRINSMTERFWMAELIHNYVRHSATAGTRNTERVLGRPSAHSLPEYWIHNNKMRCGASAPHTQNAHYCEMAKHVRTEYCRSVLFNGVFEKISDCVSCESGKLFLESMAVKYLYSTQIMGNQVNNFNRNSYSIACNSCFMESWVKYMKTSFRRGRCTHSIFICSE